MKPVPDDAVVDEKAVESQDIHPARVLAGLLAVPCLVVSFIMAIFLFLLPPLGDFVCGVLAVLGIVLVISSHMPWALKGFLGLAGLAALVAGLAQSGWRHLVASAPAQAAVQFLNWLISEGPTPKNRSIPVGDFLPVAGSRLDSSGRGRPDSDRRAFLFSNSDQAESS